MKKTQIQYKRKQKNLFVAKAIEAKAWLLLQVKIETEARFLAKRLASEATGDLANKKHFSAFFYYVPKLRSKMYALSYKHAKKDPQNLDKSPISR